MFKIISSCRDFRFVLLRNQRKPFIFGLRCMNYSIGCIRYERVCTIPFKIHWYLTYYLRETQQLLFCCKSKPLNLSCPFTVMVRAQWRYTKAHSLVVGLVPPLKSKNQKEELKRVAEIKKYGLHKKTTWRQQKMYRMIDIEQRAVFRSIQPSNGLTVVDRQLCPQYC